VKKTSKSRKQKVHWDERCKHVENVDPKTKEDIKAYVNGKMPIEFLYLVVNFRLSNLISSDKKIYFILAGK
jgi:hypothetical protein